MIPTTVQVLQMIYDEEGGTCREKQNIVFRCVGRSHFHNEFISRIDNIVKTKHSKSGTKSTIDST